jgi:hypothetical protein
MKTCNLQRLFRQEALGARVNSAALNLLRSPFCGTTQRQLSDFQIHFGKQFFGSPGKLLILPITRNRHRCCENWFPPDDAKSAEREFLERKVEKTCVRDPRFATS